MISNFAKHFNRCNRANHFARTHLNFLVNSRYFSISCPSIKQGGTITIDANEIEGLMKLEINSQWKEHCDLEFNKADTIYQLDIDEIKDDNIIEVKVKKQPQNKKIDGLHPDSLYLVASVPELFNIHVVGRNIDLVTNNKLMGDFLVQCDSGNISLDKIKGSNISILGPKVDLTISKVLEGNVSINCKSVNAKMINGETVKIQSEEFTKVGAIYGGLTELHAKGNIEIGLFQGNIKASSDKGNISIQNIDGKIDVFTKTGDIDVQINSLRHFEQDNLIYGENLNQSEPKQTKSELKNILFSKDGNINCTISPEVKSSIYCESKQENAIKIDSEVFLSDSKHTTKISGKLLGLSENNNIMDKKSGKIDIEVTSHDWSPKAPHLQILAAKNISFSTLSWMDVIKKKYGMDNK